MQPVSAADLTLRTICRAVTHLVRWVDYHAGAGARLARPGRVLTPRVELPDGRVLRLELPASCLLDAPGARLRPATWL